jgi:tetratricopeptide (TPR) repeat protein
MLQRMGVAHYAASSRRASRGGTFHRKEERVMAGRYGMTFAAKLIQEGKYAEAVEEASRAVARDDEDPAALVDRASAYAWLERYSDAVRDLEAALALDQTAGVLELDVVDDAYFSALLGAAKAEALTSIEAAERTLGRYKTVLPDGRHLEDAALWPERLRGASGGSPP